MKSRRDEALLPNRINPRSMICYTLYISQVFAYHRVADYTSGGPDTHEPSRPRQKFGLIVSGDAVETSLKAFDTPFTVLRPGYFFQNDADLKPVLTGASLYPNPIGKAGIAAVDVRDIADAAVVSLTTDGHTGKTYNLVGPDPLSGPSAAAIWSEVLNKQVRYADLPLEAFEEQLRQIFPAWLAKDLRLMFQGYEERGFAPSNADWQTKRFLLDVTSLRREI